METNNNNSLNNGITGNEFDDMRAQLEIMRRKLDHQDIITERLIQQTMSSKVSWMKGVVWLEILVLFPLICIIFAVFTHSAHLSWMPYTALVVLAGVDIYFDYKLNIISPEAWRADNLLETSRRLVRTNKWRIRQFIAGVMLTIVIFGWFAYEISFRLPPHAGIGILISGAIGGCVGLGIALFIIKKMQRTSNEIIKYIEDIKSNGETDSTETAEQPQETI